MALKRFIRLALGESIYKNSTYLLLSSTVLTLLGFVFWVIGTHVYTPYQIGITSALLAILNLITSLSLLGFEISIIRILPDHKEKGAVINSILSITGLVGLIVTIAIIFFQPHIAGSLGVMRKNTWYILLLLLFTLFSIASYMIESIFIAYRESKYIFWKNVIFSFAKIAFIFVFIFMGAFGLFSAWMFALGLAVIYGLRTLKRKFGHKFKLTLARKPLRGVFQYTTGNYVAAFIEGLPIMILPVLVANEFGPKINAYYYIAMTIATALFAVSVAATQSLFAEGSNMSEELGMLTKKAVKYIMAFTVPGILAILLLGRYLMAIFGNEYSRNAGFLLDLLAISAIPVSANTIARSILRIKYDTKFLLLVDIVGTIPIIALIYPMKSFGIDALGYSWLIGQTFTFVLFCLVFLRNRSLYLFNTAGYSKAS